MVKFYIFKKSLKKLSERSGKINVGNGIRRMVGKRKRGRTLWTLFEDD